VAGAATCNRQLHLVSESALSRYRAPWVLPPWRTASSCVSIATVATPSRTGSHPWNTTIVSHQHHLPQRYKTSWAAPPLLSKIRQKRGFAVPCFGKISQRYRWLIRVSLTHFGPHVILSHFPNNNNNAVPTTSWLGDVCQLQKIKPVAQLKTEIKRETICFISADLRPIVLFQFCFSASHMRNKTLKQFQSRRGLSAGLRQSAVRDYDHGTDNGPTDRCKNIELAKGPFIATPLNSTSSWVELCRYKRVLRGSVFLR